MEGKKEDRHKGMRERRKEGEKEVRKEEVDRWMNGAGREGAVRKNGMISQLWNGMDVCLGQ